MHYLYRHPGRQGAFEIAPRGMVLEARTILVTGNQKKKSYQTLELAFAAYIFTNPALALPSKLFAYAST